MFKNYKKLIIIFSIFFLSFNIVTEYKREEAKAIAIVDDIFFWTIGALLISATGIAVQSGGQVELGRLFTNKWVSAGNKKEELLVKGINGTLKGLYITNKLKSFINDFSFPSSVPSINNSDVDAISGLKNYDSASGVLKGNEAISKLDSNIKGSFPKGYLFSIRIPSSAVSLNIRTYMGTFSIPVNGIENNLLRLAIDSVGSTGMSGYGYVYYHLYDVSNNFLSSYQYKLWDTVYTRMTWIRGVTSKDVNGNEMPVTLQEPLDFDLTSIDTTVMNKNLVQDLPDKGYLPLPTTEVIESSKGTTIPREDIKTRVEGIPLEGDKAGTLNPDGSLELDNTKEWDIPKEIPEEGSLDGVLDDIFNPSTTKSLDFTPLQLSLADKFPFCIPFDFIKVFNIFTSNAVTPNFVITMPENLIGGGSSFEFNFNKFEKLAAILRFFILIFFITNLIKYTRDLISH